MTHTSAEKQAALTAALAVYVELADLWQSGVQGVAAAADLVRLGRRQITLAAIRSSRRARLEQVGLLEEDGTLRETIAAVVCLSVRGENLQMALTRPSSEELVAAWLDPDTVLAQYAPPSASSLQR